MAGVPETFPPLPAGIVSVRINRETGQPTTAADPDAMFELFPADRAPQRVPGQNDRRRTQEQKPSEEDLF